MILLYKIFDNITYYTVLYYTVPALYILYKEYVNIYICISLYEM